MITSWILLAALSCPDTIFENRSKFNWNKEDWKVYKIATKRCGELYKESQCVKRFIKKTDMDYSVVCGK